MNRSSSRTHRIAMAAPSLLAVSALAPATTAQICEQDMMLRLATPSVGDQLGSAVAMGPGVAVVSHLDGVASVSDAVHVFRHKNGAWVEEATLVSPNVPPSPFPGLFGRSVALDTDRIAVGAPFQTLTQVRQGGAFVFERINNVWTNTANLISPNATVDEGFGRSVALDGDTLVVGVGTGEAVNPPPSFVYVYTKGAAGWSLQAMLPAPAGADSNNDFFGKCIALYQNTLVVGAANADIQAPDAGAVFIYTRTGNVWTLDATLTQSAAPASLSDFGVDVAIDGDTILVGDDAQGEVTVFVRQNTAWIQQAVLTPSVGAPTTAFGFSVALDGDRAVVGDPTDSTQASIAGAAHVFHRVGAIWTPGELLLGSTSNANGFFGWDVAISGPRTLIGARRLKVVGVNAAGAGFIFACCPEDILGNGGVGPDDLLALLSAWGSTAAVSADIDLSGGVGPGDLLAMLAKWGQCSLPAP